MSGADSLGRQLLRELDAEVASSRKCLERIPEALFDWKPHEKSMQMGYLALLVAEIPKWIVHTVRDREIDFATFTHFQPKVTAELVKHFDDNVMGAQNALREVSDDALSGTFTLKAKGKLLASSPIGESVAQSINHLVHHRGQLTVYMRLNNIPVPSIYGPTADEKGF